MASERTELTAKFIKGYQGESGKQVIVHDTQVTQFKLSVSRKGADDQPSKSLVFVMKYKGDKIYQEMLEVWDGIKKADVEAQRNRAVEWRTKIKNGIRPEELANDEGREFTYGDLLESYCDELQRTGKSSHKQVRGDCHRHIRDQHPKIWRTPANKIQLTDCMAPCRRLIAEGKMRTQDRLRSYQMAAFNMAMAVKASKPLQVGRAGIVVNPTIGWQKEQYERKDKAPSMPTELLKQVWGSIGLLGNERAYTAKLWLLFSGQRLDQLRRIKWSDVTLGDRPVVKLKDPKGRGVVHIHEVPLTDEMVNLMRSISTEGFVFSRDRGRTQVHDRYFDDLLNLLRNHVDIPSIYTPKTIRATVTTVLTSKGVSPEIRNALQSRNRGDVETRHYQGHDYYESKLDAMLKWRQVISGDQL